MRDSELDQSPCTVYGIFPEQIYRFKLLQIVPDLAVQEVIHVFIDRFNVKLKRVP